MNTSPESLKKEIENNLLVIIGKLESSKLELMIIDGEFYRPDEKLSNNVEKEDSVIMALGIYSGKIRIKEVIKKGVYKDIVKDKIINVTWSEFIDPKTKMIMRSTCPHISYYSQPKPCVMVINHGQLGWKLAHDYPISTRDNFFKAKEILAKENSSKGEEGAKK